MRPDLIRLSGRLIPLMFLILGACQTEVSEMKSYYRAPWDKGVVYEIFVHSYCDSNGDGIGDLNGVISKLDYLQDLGVRALWLMPVHPSPSYHKYDVTDYYQIHPDYGTLEDFNRLVEEAHARDIRIIMDMVFNHSGSGHPWFQGALQGPDNPYRNYYVWSDLETVKAEIESRERTYDTDNIFQWHLPDGSSIEEEHYYGFFYHGMPDLNFREEKVMDELIDISRFWLDSLNVDGFRMDAAKYLYREHEMDKTIAAWEEYRRRVQEFKPDVYLVGEVWADSKTISGFLNGLPACFHFDLSFRIADILNNEQDTGLIRDFIADLEFYQEVNPAYQDAVFLTNHDQDRIMSLLDGNVAKARLASSLLLTLPGTPYMYYGEEIGMEGKKPDENIREPMIWSDSDDSCRTSWIQPQYNGELAPVDVQWNDPESLLNHYRSLIKLRRRNQALSEGDLKLFRQTDSSVISFTRKMDDQEVLVLLNLSGQIQEIGATGFGTILYNQGNSEVSEGTVNLKPYGTLILSPED